MIWRTPGVETGSDADGMTLADAIGVPRELPGVDEPGAVEGDVPGDDDPGADDPGADDPGAGDPGAGDPAVEGDEGDDPLALPSPSGLPTQPAKTSSTLNTTANGRLLKELRSVVGIGIGHATCGVNGRFQRGVPNLRSTQAR